MSHLSLRHVRRRAIVDGRPAVARRGSDGQSGNRVVGRPQGGRGRAAARDRRGVASADVVDLDDPVVTIALLRLNAVVGVMGKVDDSGRLTSIGVTCALCHSNVDDSLMTGIGKRLDGWANHDLNVGAIAGLAPGARPRPQNRVRNVGARHVRPAAPRIRRHEADRAEQPVRARRHPADLRAPARRLRNVYRRWPDLVLEQLRGRRADGRPGQLLRSTHRSVHQAETRSRHAES